MPEILSKQHAIVLGVVHEYLERNRYLDMEKVIPYVKNRFLKRKININDRGIILILKQLIENNYIVQGSKFTRELVLKNKNRVDIYNIIKQNPGIYFNRLVKMLNLGNHIITWHINILLKFNCIIKKEFNQHEVYFISTFRTSNYKVSYILSKNKSKKILSYMNKLENKGITKTQISKELGIHYNTINKYFKEFEEIGVIESKKIKTKTLYFITEYH